MNLAEFKKLAELLTRAEVIECGIPDATISVLRVPLTHAGQAVPFGSLGAVQLPGRNCKDPKRAKYKYRKADVAAILGYRLE